MPKNPHIGSDLDSFLEDEGILASSQIEAIKKVVSYLLQDKIDNKLITKTELAKTLGTSRSNLDRLIQNGR